MGLSQMWRTTTQIWGALIRVDNQFMSQTNLNATPGKEPTAIRGVFQSESCEKIQASYRNHFSKFLPKLDFQLAISLSNRSLIFYITPSWQLQSGSKTFGGSHCFVAVLSGNNFDQLVNDRLPGSYMT